MSWDYIGGLLFRAHRAFCLGFGGLVSLVLRELQEY